MVTVIIRRGKRPLQGSERRQAPFSTLNTVPQGLYNQSIKIGMYSGRRLRHHNTLFFSRLREIQEKSRTHIEQELISFWSEIMFTLPGERRGERKQSRVNFREYKQTTQDDEGRQRKTFGFRHHWLWLKLGWETRGIKRRQPERRTGHEDKKHEKKCKYNDFLLLIWL